MKTKILVRLKIMAMARRLLASIFVLILSVPAMAQTWDFLTCHRLKASGEIATKFSLSSEQQIRLEDNSTRVDETYTRVGVGYDLPKGLSLLADDRCAWAQNTDGSF